MRKLTCFLVSLIMIFSAVYVPSKANASSFILPKIVFVGINQPVVKGSKVDFSILTKFDGQVEYKVFYHEPGSARNIWKPIDPETNDIKLFTKDYRGNEPYHFYSSPLSKEGVYSFAIRVKRAGIKGNNSNSFGEYDDAYCFNIVVNGDTKYQFSELKGIKDIYEVGEKIKVENVVGDNLDDFEYKLNYFNLESWISSKKGENGWTIDATDYMEKLEFSGFKKPGVYAIDIWGRKKGSNNKYDLIIVKIINVYSQDEELDAKISATQLGSKHCL